jgi:S-adenosylmethionine hydrolase
MRPIVLLTDFGHRDWFAGTLKGVIASIAPGAPVLDLGHGIPPGDIRAGAFNLRAARDFFPEGSVFVAVVDPGVGGPRDGLLVSAHGRSFIGPDNGLLSHAAAGDPRRRIRILENPAYRLPVLSSTFHGRDVFAPAAAWLWKGARPSSFGPARASMVELSPWGATLEGRRLRGEILHVDRFGNAITSISAADLGRLPASPKAARAGGISFPFMRHYGEAGDGRPLSLIGSCGLLELSVNGGDASERYGLRRGGRVEMAPGSGAGGAAKPSGSTPRGASAVAAERKDPAHGPHGRKSRSGLSILD